MKYVNAAFGWLWRRKLFFGVMLGSALLFFVWFFPFSDLSQVMTTQVALATQNQVYVQSETLDLHFLPTPAISATDLSIETSLPPISASWAKFTPGLMSMLLNIRSAMRMGQDPEAAKQVMANVGFSFDAEGLFGADVDLSMGAGKKSEGGKDRSRISLAMEKLNLGQVRDWADLQVKFQGKADVETEFNFTPDFAEQPDGDYDIKISKFNMPASTVMVNMNGFDVPFNVPALTLENVTLKGRVTNGTFTIEDGQFGQSKDPLQGRIKGQMGLRFQPSGAGMPAILPGSYQFNVDLTTTPAYYKEIAILFDFIQNGRQSPTGYRYIFRMQGPGFGPPPTITRLSSI